MPGYLRYPTTAAGQLVFVAEDDLWTVSIDGGVARRLTTSLGPVSRPKLSRDGKLLAFTCREEGHDEVYVMPAEGGEPRRLTFLGADSWVVGWTRDGEIVFSTHYGQPTLRARWLAAVGPEGGHPRQLPHGPARTLAEGPGGALVIGRHTEDVSYWKRYRGGRAGVLWIDRRGEGAWEQLIELDGNLACPLFVGRRVWFVSDHEGVGNLYSCTPTGRNLERHSHSDDFCVRNPTTDGKLVVYQAGGELWRLDPTGPDRTGKGKGKGKGKRARQPRRLDVQLRSSRTQRKRKFVDAASYLEDYALSPQGTHTLLTCRGKPFAMAHWEGAVHQFGERQGVRYRLPRYLPDGERIVVVSDRGGEERLEIHETGGRPQPVVRLGRLDVGRPLTIAVSPAAEHVALTNHRQQVLVVDLEQRSRVLVEDCPHGRPSHLAWSPCGGWLAYSTPTTDHTRSVALFEVATGERTLVTPPHFRDYAPAWDPAGDYLYFLSYRVFDPVYDSHFFELSFPKGARPYAIGLRADVPSPFLPAPRAPGAKRSPNGAGAKSGANGAPAKAESTGKKKGKKPAGKKQARKKRAKQRKGSQQTAQGKTAAQASSGNGAPEPLRIDLAGIERRVVPFPLREARYTQIAGLPGKVLLAHEPVRGSLDRSWRAAEDPPRATLECYDFERLERTVHATPIHDFALSADSKTLIYRAGRKLRVVEAGKKPDQNGAAPSRNTGWLRLSRVRVEVDPAAEWAQMLREAWRLMRDQFWTHDMSGVDWESIHDTYAPLVERVSTRAELSDLIWEMQGELGTSHAYEMGGDYRPQPRYRQGFLGVDLSLDRRGHYRIDRVVEGDPWSPARTSPMNRLGVGVVAGDTLLAIDGELVGRGKRSPQELLVHRAGQEVEVTVGDAAGKQPRRVTVRCLGSETRARYRDWVEANRQRVHDSTGGRVGYLHVPNMGPEGYAEFHRALLAELDRPSLIVDVRGNGGGHVSSLLLEKLARRRIGYTVSRWATPTPYPRESFAGPLVALTDENAGSDGDIFGHGFQLLGLGPLIGTRSWGGVVGIWPRHRLVDGSVTTQPEFSFWFEDVGWGLENRGAVPDIAVEFPPHAHAAGEDPQLTRAIEETLRLLDADAPELPDFSDRPRLARSGGERGR